MSVSMTASLTDLPTELLSLVVTKIASKSTLCSLAGCSHRLYLCTIPHLYGHITIQEDGEQQDERLIMLTTSLLRRPDLAKLVRHFSLHATQPSGIIASIKIRGASATLFDPLGLSQEEVVSCLARCGYPFVSRHDTTLSILLPSMLNVESLVLDVKICIHSHFLEKVIRRAVARKRPLDAQQPFKTLTVFDQSSHDVFSSRDVSSMASLLKLPAIQKISGNFDKLERIRKPYYENDFDEVKSADVNLMELDSYSSPLTSLNIASFGLPTIDMYFILRVPIALKHFSFTTHSFLDFYWEDMPNVLEAQKHCLQSITMDYDPISVQQEIEIAFYLAPMESFTRFTALKVFKTAGLFLTETVHGSERYNLLNIFPPSLETLYLTRFQSGFKKLLESLERLLAFRFPRQIPLLKTLILEERISGGAPQTRLKDVLWGNTQESTTEKLSEVAKYRNVVFEVIEESTD
ncbi:hypothetical protein MMC22_005901 [Lobaria immixta]|nr:hypothetical protein [Lobaria immixta]